MKPFNLKEYIKSPNKKVITRNGRPVKIIYTDKKGMYPVVALIEYNNTYENVFAFTADGRYSFVETDEKDLFFAPEKKIGWVNLYKDESSHYLTGGPVYNNEADAVTYGSGFSNYIKTIKLEWEEEQL